MFANQKPLDEIYIMAWYLFWWNYNVISQQFVYFLNNSVSLLYFLKNSISLSQLLRISLDISPKNWYQNIYSNFIIIIIYSIIFMWYPHILSLHGYYVCITSYHLLLINFHIFYFSFFNNNIDYTIIITTSMIIIS